MNYLQSLNQIVNTVITNFPLIGHCVFILWMVHMINFLMGYRLNILGIIPRKPIGLLGIIFSPLLHGSFGHLIMNSFFFFCLSSIVLIKGKITFWTVSCVCAWIEGFLVWCFGRNAIHVGMSGVIVGYWTYLMTSAYLSPTFANVLGAGVGFFYFGVDLLASMVPSNQKQVSTEGHFFGGVAGVVCAYYIGFFTKQLKPLTHLLSQIG